VGENICKSLSHKELVSNTHKELSKLNSKKSINVIRKQAKNMKRRFTVGNM
jgi:hypothetical protein